MEKTFTVAHNNDKSKSLQIRPSLIVNNMSTSKINKTNVFHCPNCKRLFSKQCSLKLHLPSCRRMHVAAEDSHYEVNYHPLRSCHYITDNNFSLNNDEYSNSGDNHHSNDYIDDSNLFSDNSSVLSENFDHADRFITSYVEAQQQQSTAASKLQIKLNHLINCHKAPLKLYDDIVNLFNKYISSNNFNRYARLKSRKSFLKANETTYNVTHLRPKHKNVVLTDGSEVTVPVFDAKSMILDLITNPATMNIRNIAAGYDMFIGNVNETLPENQCYGEIHMGNQWVPARNRYCTNNEMPIALIIFGDKSHTDLHGSLSLTPIIFTLTFFNQSARNTTNFWRPLAYIPNLSYGKNKADKRPTSEKIQDEHICLSVAFGSIKDIHRSGGFYATVMGRAVKIKVWIHYFIGDTEGFNKWLGHYPGNKKQISRPYRDCHCGYDELKNPNPSCVYATLDNMREAKRVKLNNYNEGLELLKSMSRYDIKNAFISKHLPLSDNEHGPYGMMPLDSGDVTRVWTGSYKVYV